MGVYARAQNRRRHRHRHGEGPHREDRLADCGETSILIAAHAVLGHRILDRLPLADEIKHHHRMGEQRHHGREDAIRDVSGDVGALETEDGRRDQPQQTKGDRGEKRLSQRDRIIVDPPSPFIAEWLPRIIGATAVPARALDIAMGRGRHAAILADAGFHTFGVDVKLDAIREAVNRLAGQQVIVRAWCADLTNYPLPRHAFELVVVSRYLQRDLFPSLRETVVPGGFVLYETFTVRQRALGTGPASADHLLEEGELPRWFDGFEVLLHEEVVGTDAVARLVARKPPSV